MIGKCAFKAYSATNAVCTVLAIVLAVCALVIRHWIPALIYCMPYLGCKYIDVL
ncbi:MAG: DUF3169 family protein [Acutalibacteraceae bacterium]